MDMMVDIHVSTHFVLLPIV
ncbi:unnamed protein product [Timema podura]|uniref:Uncharacterized protein n=1 Tax=Timema podura TaxID=61482 RepID=A0ABN7PEX4_TIMPD|nr:unnamed protein product [Timema podura]